MKVKGIEGTGRGLLPVASVPQIHKKGPAKILIALSMCLSAALLASTAQAAEQSPIQANPQAVKEYWTPQRMQAAKPAPAPPVGEATVTKTLNAGPIGQPGGVEPSEPTATSAKSSYAGNGVASYPKSTNGKVYFQELEHGRWKNFVCSATVVATENQSVAWTAGHCVYGSTWNRAWEFVPAYHDGVKPYGKWVAKSLSTTNEWANGNQENYDIGAATLNPNGRGKVANVVGSRGIEWNVSANQYFRAYGYPAAYPFDGETLYTAASQFQGYDYSFSAPYPIRMVNNMTGGSSGGAWIISGGYINGHNDYGPPWPSSKTYSPYYGNAAKNLYNSVRY